MKALDRGVRTKISAEVRQQVLKKHFNLFAVDYGAWSAKLDAESPRLLSETDEGFVDGVRRLLAELKTSHTTFYRDVPTKFPSQLTIGATFRKTVDGKWMFLDVFDQGPAAQAGIGSGDVLESIDGAEAGTTDPPQFAVGRTCRIALADRVVEVIVPLRKATKGRPPLVEPKAVTASVASPGEGVLTVRYFPGMFGMRFGAELDAAVKFLKSSGCEKLVLNLCGNIGGSLGFARLASYLVPDHRPIGYSLTPERLRAGYQVSDLPSVPMPSNRLALMATFARFMRRDKSLMLLTQGLGPQPFHGNITVAVNEWTSSAAEIVAAFAKANDIPITGTATRGNVLGAINVAVGGDCWLRLPVFGWYCADGSILEGKGVIPDSASGAANSV
jgi:carboxyl-terminal processing protease